MSLKDTNQKFQSTLSIQRVTIRFVKYICDLSISIHTLYTESDTYAADEKDSTTISIHTLYTESDCIQLH